MKKIIASTDFSTRSNRALRQAGLLAQPVGAQLYVLHVVDDDQPDELVRLEQREAERLIDEQLRSMPELRNLRSQALVATGSAFEGILNAANEIHADLIVMGSHRRRILLDIFVGTTIERVIRNGSFPVLMVNNEAQRRYERVVAPVDLSGASANALDAALSLGLIGDKGATLLHAFVALARGKMFIANTSKADIERYVASERQRATDELAAFLVANDLGRKPWSLRVEEGDPIEVISQAVSSLAPDLLVMGTRGRSGMLKFLIGSVTEEALSSLGVDILAVPPRR
jgi:nucleotide-binding universal stress UspA family protein